MAYREHTQTILKDSNKTVQNFEFDLNASIEHIAHWLPAQGPIKDFIHHNTLHAVQHHPFHEGVAVAAKIFGARSYLPLEDYQQMHQQGRIKNAAIDWAIEHSGYPQQQHEKLRKTLFERDDTGHYPPVSLANHGIRNAWLTRLEVDLNALVHPVLFRLLGNFLDQGISRWSLPKNGEHFWDCVLRLAQNSLLPLYPLNEPEVSELLSENPDHVIKACLKKIVGDEQLYEQYLLEMLLAHPGWAGMVHVIEHSPKSLLARREISLKEMIAVELAIELAFLHKKRGLHFAGITAFPHSDDTPLLKAGALKPKIPLHLKVWHEAMEWSLHSELLLALKPKTTLTAVPNPAMKPLPEAQALFCIDDRECSLRRHLEESNPAIETLGAAGFFGIDFLYQGLDDAYPVAQCPNIIVPKHLIKEASSKPNDKAKSGNRAHMHFTAHSMFRGWLYTQTLGIGYAVRMAWNVFRPGSKLPNIRTLSEVESHTHLHLLRESEEPTEDGYLLGFSFTEMADRVGGLLRNIGLTQHFAPLVVIVAHGSSSVNNPHFAAYDCGACSGKPGAPNARAFAWMANHKSVRAILHERGIEIPDDTRFIAALHNTSRDEITYFDNHLLEQHPAPGLPAFQQAMKKALQENAGERCRWFELGPQSQSSEEAHQHVIERASSIFEPRPEYNHSNNLYAIVGRRALTRDLFMDRRAFLHSYDPKTDAQGDIMARILSAIIPVCGGINLEYLFSRIDNSVYGAGTKLPHNVIGLLGVANGVEGDLRTGLPSQMIEVHQPARLLIVVEQTPAILDKTLAKLGALKEWLDNEWVRFVACHPENRELFLYSVNGWEKVKFADDSKTPQATLSEQIIVGQTETIPVHQFMRRQA
ncbi:YbcC family protein [Methylobacter sp.]|uniref:YbcC family protein n=1 Tax=Methylobacter sp. TaxID=2051955 RepID=UPI002FDD61BE